MTNYKEILQILPALIEDNVYDMTILSNTSALLYEHLENINWVGFYINKNNTLLLGPFQGKVACTTIPFSKGVCGACASTLKTILVPNVHEFKGHIACDSASNSEICIPIIIHNQLYAILDIDSPILNRFKKEDQIYLESIIEIITGQLEKII
ncbi:GAF domain-containing protein [bacterium]|nr:GAF domain-containing protein [bacterium]